MNTRIDNYIDNQVYLIKDDKGLVITAKFVDTNKFIDTINCSYFLSEDNDEYIVDSSKVEWAVLLSDIIDSDYVNSFDLFNIRPKVTTKMRV